jgi:hypothetical protein
MKSKIATATLVVLVCLMLAFAGTALAEDAPEAGWSGILMPKLLFFDYSGGPGDDRNHFLERYQLRDGLVGDDRSGLDLDLDLNLIYSRGSRHLFTLERRGEGRYNNFTLGRFNAEKVAVSAYFSRYGSATGGIDYLYSPNQVPGGTDPSYNTPPQTASGYFARFNDDSSRSAYTSDRKAFGAGVGLKPALLGGVAAVDLRYDGYQRDGNRFSPWVAGGGDFAGPQLQLQRWRGYDQSIDENMGKVSLGLTLSPGGLFQLAYAGAIEKFDNQARTLTIGDFASLLPPGNTVAGTNGTKPLHFVPDSKLTTHGLRLSKSFGNSVIAAGYGISLLEQESFTERQRAANYDTGEISSDNAFLTFNSRLSKTAALEAHVKYFSRDNDSTFPAPGLISDVEDQELAVRINDLETFEYGVSAAFRPAGWKSSLSAGWKREDTSRDLTFHVSPGITAQRSLYSEDSLSDEIYLKFVSRPSQGLTLRVTPSYLWADRTGLIVEPEESLNLKTLVSYVTPRGTMVSGYYNYKDEQNTNKSYTNAVAPTGVDGASVDQDVDQTLHSAGAALSLTPAAGASLSLGVDWIQNDFESFYFSTNRRRFENPAGGITFTRRDRSQYKIDTLSASLGGDWRPRESLTLNGGYTYARSEGDVGSGLVARELASTTDGTIDTTLHTLLFGASFEPKKGLGLWAQYLFEDYENDSYDLVSGSLHTITVGFAFKL